MGNCNVCAQADLIYRGTTPTFIIMLPEDFDASLFEEAYLTFTQAGRVIFEKTITDMDYDQEEPYNIMFTLTGKI